MGSEDLNCARLKKQTDFPKYKPQLPASGPYLKTDLAFAIAWLEGWCVDEGLDRASPANEDASIYRALLTESLARMSGETVPILTRSEVGIPARAKITGRCWKRFSNWFGKETEPKLSVACKKARAAMLHPVRVSNGTGGRPESSEAQYYFSYSPPQSAQQGSSDAEVKPPPDGDCVTATATKEASVPGSHVNKPKTEKRSCSVEKNNDEYLLLDRALESPKVTAMALASLAALCLLIIALAVARADKTDGTSLGLVAVQFVFGFAFPSVGGIGEIR